MTTAPLDATAAAEHFLAGARDGGLQHVCISPGSRSTPLAIAALRTPGLTTSIHLDERVAGFAALGNSLATGQATALICTSGTAAANYLPALSEANMSNVALIALTADRPPEHWSWGVGQTFPQTGLYQHQVRAEFSMPVGGDAGGDFSARAGWRAARTAIEQRGPVHVNWPFRLPLEPQSGPQAGTVTFSAPDLDAVCHRGEVASLASLLETSKAPVIIAGPGSLNGAGHTGSSSAKRYSSAHVIHEAAGRAAIPILADSLSGLRGPNGPTVVHASSLIFQRSPQLLAELAPDLIITIGQTPTNKQTRIWRDSSSATQVLLDPLSDWNDPSHSVDYRFVSDPALLLEAATANIAAVDGWLDRWKATGARTAEIAETTLAEFPETTDAHVAAQVGAALDANSHLFTSSSMPVRDVDTYVGFTSEINVHANRGINGIDGVVATASGFARAADARIAVLIGDVALLHDIGGILDAARNQTPLVVIVANNDGGGIFSLLPVKDEIDPDDFDLVFNTSHGTTFDFLGQYPNITYQRSTNIRAAVEEAFRSPKSPVTVIEISVSTEARLTYRNDLADRLLLP